MATHSSILAFIIPWTEMPGGLQSMGPQSQMGLNDYSLGIVYPRAKFLSISGPVKLICFQNMMVRQRIDFPIQKGRK